MRSYANVGRKKGAPKTIVSYNICDKLVKKIDDLAEENCIAKSLLVENILKRYLY